MKQENESLYALYNEKVNKSKKLQELRDEIETIEIRKKYIVVKEKLESVTSKLNVMIESQDKINSKRAATIMKLQQDLLSSTLTAEKDNILLLPQNNQKDLKNIVENKEKVEDLLCSVQNHDFYSSTEKAIEEAQTISVTWNKQLAKDIHLFKSSKGLYTNVLKMQKPDLDKSFQEEFEIESDLGCHSLDDSTSNSTSDCFGFGTSSPILCNSGGAFTKKRMTSSISSSIKSPTE